MKESESYFVHESAYVDEPCEIGEGTRIWHFSHVMKGAKIGRNCILGQNVNVGSRAVIGDGCKIQNNVSVYDDVKLEEEVFCGPSAVFTNVVTPRAFISRKHEYHTTLVKRGATLGANCTVLCGNTIGRYALVAAGAVVTKDIPDFALAAGVPARRIGWVCRCGVTLPSAASGEVKCEACGMQYTIQGEQLIEEGGS